MPFSNTFALLEKMVSSNPEQFKDLVNTLFTEGVELVENSLKELKDSDPIQEEHREFIRRMADTLMDIATFKKILVIYKENTEGVLKQAFQEFKESTKPSEGDTPCK